MLRAKTTILAAMTALALAGCSSSVPTPAFSSNRAIDQDIAATHVVGPTTTSPALTQVDTTPTTLTPWRNEQLAATPDAPK